MGRVLLKDLLRDLGSLDQNATIFVESGREPSPDSEVILRPIDAVGRPEGYRYLLEVYIAKEVVGIWSNWREGKVPAIEDICEAVIHYAVNDAYLPVADA